MELVFALDLPQEIVLPMTLAEVPLPHGVTPDQESCRLRVEGGRRRHWLDQP